MQIDPGDIKRSWQTRMDSVGRQFLKLSSEPVLDTVKDQMVHICGMYLVPMPDNTMLVRVNVAPTDCDTAIYSTSLDNLER